MELLKGRLLPLLSSSLLPALVLTRNVGLPSVRPPSGADIVFNRAHRLDVCLVQNHPIALYVPRLGPTSLEESGVRLRQWAEPASTPPSFLSLSLPPASPPPLRRSSVFLPASDIPRFVALGSVSLGITGQDVIVESGLEHLITELLPLDFGKCALQVQVPVNSGYETIEQLSGKRIATSFEVMAGKLFKEVDVKVGGQAATEVEYVGGSVEAACALGVADGIVDLVGQFSACSLVLSAGGLDVRKGELLTLLASCAFLRLAESGDTMRAAGLHPIHTLMQSQAVLITSSEPHPTLPAETLQSVLSLVKSRIAGVLAAQQHVLCTYNIPRSRLAEATKFTPGRRAPTVSSVEADGWAAVSVLVKRKGMADVMDRLTEVGAEDILITRLENCRV